MKQRRLFFIYNQETNKFLLLTIAKHSHHTPKDRMFTITEEITNESDSNMGIIRKIKKETGLEIIEIFNLNWGSAYKEEKDEFKNMNFIAFVNSNRINLDGEYSKYGWLTLDDFIKKIDWEDSKELLKRVLIKGINREAYFDKKERGE